MATKKTSTTTTQARKAGPSGAERATRVDASKGHAAKATGKSGSGSSGSGASKANARGASKSRGAGATKASAGKSAVARSNGDAPSLFRINIEVGDLDAAADFYGALLAQTGRKQAGSRVYFTAGAVTLQVVDVSSQGAPHTAAKALYFLADDLDAVFARAKELDCLSTDDVHGSPAGQVVVRPWGERSFYADDPWGNPLCFVEAGTTYPG